MEKKLKNLKKIVLTGGHAASSALVVAEEIKRQNKPWDIYWIGFKSSVEGENISTLSSIYFPKYGIKTFTLVTGRVQRNWTVHTIPSILKIPVGFIHAFMLLVKIKPGLILSFGGF
jgi:UDP-N-acetylglucosamine:LPS N-acetylglucosamine transferase